jgi:hypothetical protein
VPLSKHTRLSDLRDTLIEPVKNLLAHLQRMRFLASKGGGARLRCGVAGDGKRPNIFVENDSGTMQFYFYWSGEVLHSSNAGDWSDVHMTLADVEAFYDSLLK